MKTENANTPATVIVIVLVLASAAGLGYGIKQIRWTLVIRKNLAESKTEVQVVESEPEVEVVPESEPEVEVAEIDATVVEEPAWEEPEEEPQPEVAAEPQRQPWQMGPNSGAVLQFFANLNLNEEEQARLREGFALMRRQFENMSAEDRMAEFAQMAEIREQWRNMSDQEREVVTEQMRERYEQWRNSDSIEIPRLTLD